jgi:hypothetical protein
VLVVVDLDRHSDPPKILALGPDQAGNLIEMVWLQLEGGEEMVIHAMPMRPRFAGLLLPMREEP